MYSAEKNRARVHRYAQTHKEKIRATKHKYYKEHKDKCRAINQKSYQRHREERLEHSRKYYWEHRQEYKIKRRIYAKKWNHQLKLDVLSHYSNNGLPQCAKCGIIDLDVLCIDHIKGGGAKQRKSISTSFLYWLKMKNYPNGYQILCANCNLKKRMQEDENRH